MHPFIVNLYLAEPILDFVNKEKIVSLIIVASKNVYTHAEKWNY